MRHKSGSLKTTTEGIVMYGHGVISAGSVKLVPERK